MTVSKTRYPGGKREAGRASGERGEGVISTAIAVLVMAFIGVAMWIAFDSTFNHAAAHVDRQVNCIGQTTTGC